MNSLTRLREITPHLPLLADFAAVENSRVDYSIDGAECYGHPVYVDEHIAIQRVFVGKGGTFPMHTHEMPVHEMCMVMTGRYHFCGQDMFPGDAIQVEPGVAHDGVALEDSWILCATVPPGAGYPGVPT